MYSLKHTQNVSTLQAINLYFKFFKMFFLTMEENITVGKDFETVPSGQEDFMIEAMSYMMYKIGKLQYNMY